MSWDQLREMGSSPRIRGKPEPHAQRRRAPGLIPAHTGKTHRVNQGFILSWAHPRAYGENVELPALSTQFRGSSPRIRGKRLLPNGKAPDTLAHPRAYGENVVGVRASLRFWGSSPRIRGKHGCELIIDGCHGLIPAHTGKTRALSDRCRGRRAHPRAYGENAGM